jgi:hypothetical protein
VRSTSAAPSSPAAGFSGGEVSFGGAEFSGGEAYFGYAELMRGDVEEALALLGR